MPLHRCFGSCRHALRILILLFNYVVEFVILFFCLYYFILFVLLLCFLMFCFILLHMFIESFCEVVEKSWGSRWEVVGKSLGSRLGFGSRLEVVRKSFGSRLEVVGKSFGSRSEVVWKSFGSRWEVVGKSLGSRLEVVRKSLGSRWEDDHSVTPLFQLMPIHRCPGSCRHTVRILSCLIILLNLLYVFVANIILFICLHYFVFF